MLEMEARRCYVDRCLNSIYHPERWVGAEEGCKYHHHHVDQGEQGGHGEGGEAGEVGGVQGESLAHQVAGLCSQVSAL